MKQHEKRFIIEAKGANRWFRSGNDGLRGFFATRQEANKALANGEKSYGVEYRVRQK